MTKTELLYYLDSIDFGKEFNKFVNLAKHCLNNTYGKLTECDLGGVTAKDIVQEIITALIDKPEKIPKGISIADFRNKIGGMINNTVKSHVRKTKMTTSYDPTEQIEDEAFLDFVLSEKEWEDRTTQNQIRISAIFDDVSELLLLSDQDSWIVLSDLRLGKKPKEIAETNGINIKDVRNSVKKIYRLVKSKASVPV